jgi:membrane dipeptidase
MARASKAKTALAHAETLLRRIALVDGHNDLPWVIRKSPAKGDVRAYDLSRRHDDGDTDLPRLKAGRLSGQIWAAFIPTEAEKPARAVLEQIDIILQMHEAHPDVFLPAKKPSDFVRARRLGRIASMIAVEGGVGLENSLGPLRVWHAAGARLVTLCHNGTLDWVDSATDAPRHNGLSAFGKAVVRELNRLGMMVDCAHVSTKSMHDVLDTSSAPIVFSHSNARALCDHPRNVPDDVLDRLPANGGLVMTTFIPDFLNEATRRWMMPLRTALAGRFTAETQFSAIAERERRYGPLPRATLAHVADHIEYIAQRIGPERVGIGSDFFGAPTTPQGLEDVSRFPFLIAEMVRRGWSDKAIAGLAGGNFIRVFRAVEKEGQRLRKSHAPLVGRTTDLDQC